MTNNNMYFVANWKMYGNLSSINSVKSIKIFSKRKELKKTKIIYCPPYTLLRPLVKKLKNSNIKVGAQNCHHQSNFGSFTGSVNAQMIKSLGCQYVILGHSENRIDGETDKIINLKIKSAIKEKLNVIFCIGESFKEKKNNKTKIVLKKQILNGLKNISKLNKIIIAYEPIWSIGSGRIPESKDLNAIVRFIKSLFIKKSKFKSIKVLYGGSVNPKNIKKLSKIRSIDGFLIGGASQKTKNFIDIIKKTII